MGYSTQTEGSSMNNQLALKGAFNCPKTFAGYLMHGLLLLIRIYL
jgi:hypothetical protein